MLRGTRSTKWNTFPEQTPVLKLSSAGIMMLRRPVVLPSVLRNVSVEGNNMEPLRSKKTAERYGREKPNSGLESWAAVSVAGLPKPANYRLIFQFPLPKPA